MITVEDALKTILKRIKILDAEAVKLTGALERILAEDVYSNSNIPALDNSAMDGYALKACDTHTASRDNPKLLEVIGDLKAGDVPKKKLQAHQAIRIMTGALIPKGADSVIMVEDTEKEAPGKVKIFKEVCAGENVREAGEDIQKGELVISKGTLLKPSHIGLLASLGRANVQVVRRPRVAILATGNEVVDVRAKLTPGKLRSSNTYALYSQVVNCGGLPKNLGIAKDRLAQLEKKIGQGLDCDLILTSGGVSVGDYDLVKEVLAGMGTRIHFWKVAMRPGKPLVFGMIKGIPIFGLPGNPVSSMVSFEIFVRSAILKMAGQNNEQENEVEARSEEDISKRKGLRYFLRAKTQWDGAKYTTRTTGPQGSGILKSMALANSLIILPEETGAVRKGARVKIRFLK